MQAMASIIARKASMPTAAGRSGIVKKTSGRTKGYSVPFSDLKDCISKIPRRNKEIAPMRWPISGMVTNGKKRNRA